jgi:hypothetical protein
VSVELSRRKIVIKWGNLLDESAGLMTLQPSF